MDEQPRKGPLPFLGRGVAQVAILVEDLERSVEAYWKQFGIGPWHFYTYEKPLLKKMSYMGEAVEYSMRIALSYIGDLRIELIEPGEGPTIYRDFVREHGYGVHHFGLLVDDMEAALQIARAQNWRMTQDGSGFGRDGDGRYAYLDTEDELGVTLELIERPKGRVKPEKIYPPEE
jgi:methylmalonyl-CoA/ethylmalonyl-CoA epimerase